MVLEYDEVAGAGAYAEETKRRIGTERLSLIPTISISIQIQDPIVLHGPLTARPKMGHDLMISTWPAVEREIRNWPLFKAKDPSILGMYAKYKRQADAVGRLVARLGHPRSIHGT